MKNFGEAAVEAARLCRELGLKTLAGKFYGARGAWNVRTLLREVNAAADAIETAVKHSCFSRTKLEPSMRGIAELAAKLIEVSGTGIELCDAYIESADRETCSSEIAVQARQTA